MLPVRIRFHPPCDPAASRKFPRNRDQPAGNPVLFAKGFQFHDRRSSVECQNLIGLFCSHTLPLCLKGDLTMLQTTICRLNGVECESRW